LSVVSIGHMSELSFTPVVLELVTSPMAPDGD
jgi:hypothetical protein